MNAPLLRFTPLIFHVLLESLHDRQIILLLFAFQNWLREGLLVAGLGVHHVVVVLQGVGHFFEFRRGHH